MNALITTRGALQIPRLGPCTFQPILYCLSFIPVLNAPFSLERPFDLDNGILLLVDAHVDSGQRSEALEDLLVLFLERLGLDESEASAAMDLRLERFPQFWAGPWSLPDHFSLECL